MKNHKLYGRRVLHFLSPVRFEKNVFKHTVDSNYKCVEKTIEFLPMCHHYVVVPENNIIEDNRMNVTLLKYPYPKNAVSNRATFNYKAFRKILDFKQIDIDFVFSHQPELLFNIFTVLMDERYGEVVNRFLFFHWVDCPQSRGSTAIPHSYMRQLDAINQCNKAFFHTDISSEYFLKNFTKQSSTNLNLDYVKSKSSYFPIVVDEFPEPQPFELPDKKIIVFNHRWNVSTGWRRMVKYTEDLGDDFLIWSTDSKAPKKYVGKGLPFSQYGYLLKQSLCSVCFVDSYATWNLSVQDGLKFDKPVLCYEHPAMKKILGDDYPLFFKTKEQFLNLLEKIQTSEYKNFKWELPNHEKNFRKNVINSMEECIDDDINSPKDALKWIYCILNGYKYKKDITKQVQPNLMLNSVWYFIRRWILMNGVVDDPNSKITKYTVLKDKKDKLKKLTKSVNLMLKPFMKKRTLISKKNHTFF